MFATNLNAYELVTLYQMNEYGKIQLQQDGVRRMGDHGHPGGSLPRGRHPSVLRWPVPFGHMAYLVPDSAYALLGKHNGERARRDETRNTENESLVYQPSLERPSSDIGSVRIGPRARRSSNPFFE